MKANKLFLTITILVIAFSTQAQHTMTLLNGKEIFISKYNVGDFTVEYDITKKNKIKTRAVNKFRVFDIQDANGSAITIYQSDSLDKYSMSIAQVRDYIDGEQFAMQTYRKDLNTAASFTVGASGGLLSFYGLPVPFIYGLVVERFAPEVPMPEQGLPANAGEESFEIGYQQKVRAIKLKQNLIGGGIGFAVGITVFTLWLGDVEF